MIDYAPPGPNIMNYATRLKELSKQKNMNPFFNNRVTWTSPMNQLYSTLIAGAGGAAESGKYVFSQEIQLGSISFPIIDFQCMLQRLRDIDGFETIYTIQKQKEEGYKDIFANVIFDGIVSIYW